MYDSFLLADWWVTPDVFVTALWVRLALVTPFIFALSVAFYADPPPFLRELYAVVGTLVAAGSSLYLMVLSRSPHQDGQQQSIILAVLFVTLVQRVRFWYSIPACLGCLRCMAELSLCCPAMVWTCRFRPIWCLAASSCSRSSPPTGPNASCA